MSQNIPRVLAAFRRCETDDSGVIDADLFERAARLLGLKASAEAIASLYQSLLAEQDGPLDIRLLARSLRTPQNDRSQVAARLEASTSFFA